MIVPFGEVQSFISFSTVPDKKFSSVVLQCVLT